jgi:hypothetical protein
MATPAQQPVAAQDAPPIRWRPPRTAQVDPAESRVNVRHAGVTMIVAFVLMALFNSEGLASYARDLPAGWLADALVVGADRWHALMLALGPAELRPAFTEALEWIRARSW